jgi:hypothetical protein
LRDVLGVAKQVIMVCLERPTLDKPDVAGQVDFFGDLPILAWPLADCLKACLCRGDVAVVARDDDFIRMR